jgi:DNA-binding HxlR family transcriptional regulator
MEDITAKQAKRNREDGFIHREVYPVVPPKVEYSLIERGQRSIPVIAGIREYGFGLMKEFGIDEGEENIKI